jgi:ATP-dependent Lon protease
MVAISSRVSNDKTPPDFNSSFDGLGLMLQDGEAVVADSTPLPASASGLVLPDQILPSQLFVIPTPGPIIYPTLIAPMMVWHPTAMATVEEVLAKQKYIGLLLTKEETLPDDPKLSDLYSYGIIAKILKRIKLPDGNIHILVQGLKRFKVKRALSEKPLLMIEPEYFDEAQPEKTIELDALTRNVINHVRELSESHPFFNEEMKVALLNAPNSGIAADIVAFALGLPKSESQSFLETISVTERFEKLLVHLKREQDVADVQKKINDEVNNRLNTLQREFFLREQMKLIKKELGMEEDGKDKSTRSFRERIKEAKMPEDVEKIALEEVEKFETLNEQSPEYNISRNYLDILCGLPWSNETKDLLNLTHAREILDQDHSGLEKVKQRIIEFIAIRNLQSKNPEASKKGSIILLVGPPGVGKTSIGKSIAKSMGRNFYRFSLGGMRDEAEIKGHRRTYIGAMPGKFIQAAKRAGSKNAVIMLDEIDKLSSSYHGDPASALLEVLDPEQNVNFLDHYLDVPFDLSQMIFIATANSTDTIPEPLLDRMEVIQLNGYTFEEKEQIAKRHLIPRVFERAGLSAHEIKIDRKTLKAIIHDYAREPGLRVLEQLLEKLSRKVAAKIVERRESKEKLRLPILIEEEELLGYLGPKRFSSEMADRMTAPGVMIGLAWTQMGGEILFIEAAELPGSGQIKLTGKMGEVMLESAQIAWTFVKKRLIEEGILTAAQLKEKDVHVHIPAGAIPKDGPSAGITLASALYSLFTGRKARHRTAMTGELSLTGKVLPIGGVRDKLLGAKRAGIETVVLPAENKRDLYDLPIELLKSLDIHFVSKIDEVFQLVISQPKGVVKALPQTAAKPTRRRRAKKAVKKPASRKISYSRAH